MTSTKSMKMVADAITFADQIEPSIRAKEHEVLRTSVCEQSITEGIKQG